MLERECNERQQTLLALRRQRGVVSSSALVDELVESIAMTQLNVEWSAQQQADFARRAEQLGRPAGRGAATVAGTDRPGARAAGCRRAGRGCRGTGVGAALVCPGAGLHRRRRGSHAQAGRSLSGAAPGHGGAGTGSGAVRLCRCGAAGGGAGTPEGMAARFAPARRLAASEGPAVGIISGRRLLALALAQRIPPCRREIVLLRQGAGGCRLLPFPMPRSATDAPARNHRTASPPRRGPGSASAASWYSPTAAPAAPAR